MLPRCSNSLASLALIFSVLIPHVHAGEKIEFSAPGSPLSVPKVIREDKEPPKSDNSMGPGSEPTWDNQFMAPAPVIISRAKSRDSLNPDFFSSDPAVENQSRDNESIFTDRPTENARVELNTPTNRWNMQRGWNSTPVDVFTEHKTEYGQTDDKSRDPLNAANRTAYDDSDRYRSEERNSSENTEDSAWSRNIFHHGATPLERMHEGQFVPFDEDRSSEHALAVPGHVLGSGDPTTDYAMPSADATSRSSIDSMRSTAAENMFSAPREFRAEEERRTTQEYGQYSRPAPPSSPRGQVQSRPAVLLFPKKPGDPF